MKIKPLNNSVSSNKFPKPPLIKTPPILQELFIYNNYSHYIPIIKSPNTIEHLYSNLKHPKNDNDLLFLLQTLESLILANPDIIPLLSPINSSNQFFTTLIEVYLIHCEPSNFNEQILEIILRMCNFLTHCIIITKAQYQKVYSFLTENNNLSIETTKKIFYLLEILYIHFSCIISKIKKNDMPLNYIVHNGEGYIEISNNGNVFEKDGKVLNIVMNFYIRSIGDDMQKFFHNEKNNTLEYPSSIFEIIMNDGGVFKICIEESYKRMFCLYDASHISKLKQRQLFAIDEEVYWYTNLEEDSWYSLTLCFNHHNGIISSLVCKLCTIPNHSECDTSIFKTNIHNLDINKIISIKSYNNFYGMSTSIIMSDLVDEKEKIKTESIKKFGIYNKKTFTAFNDENKFFKYNIKVKCFSPHKHSFLDKHRTIILSDLFNNVYECKIINKYFYTNTQLQNNNESHFFVFNQPHIYKNKTKNFYDLGSINQLLPVLEILIRKNCLNKETFLLFFTITKLMLLKNKMNFLDAISHDFFISLSILLESIDKKHYSKAIYEGIISINSFYLGNINYLCEKETNVEKIISFPRYIFFNYYLIKKFDTKTSNFLLNEISFFLNKIVLKQGEFSNSKIEILFIENILTIKGLIHILRDIDRFYPDKMCCIKHALFYGKQAINFTLDESFGAFEGIFDTVVLLMFSVKKPIFESLLRLMALPLSPCMKKFLFKRLKKFIENIRTNTGNLSEFKKYCKNEDIPTVIMYLISVSDILVQFKLINLYSFLFDIVPDTFKSENNFNMMKSCLFLNNKSKEKYVSQELTSIPTNIDASISKKRSLSSNKKEIDEGILYMSNTTNSKSNMFYTIKQNLENGGYVPKCELINFYEVIPSHNVKEFSDKRKAYLLQLFEKLRQLFLSKADIKIFENDVLKRRCLFLFNCLCIFVARSNDIKILTLFCESMKELEMKHRKIYYTFVYESQDYFDLLLDNYVHLKVLQDSNFTDIGSSYIDKEKGVITESIKKIITILNKTLLDLIKGLLLRKCYKLQRFYNFCIFNQLLYQHNSNISYMTYIKTLCYELFAHLLNELRPDINTCNNINIYILVINTLFDFCFVFDHNYDLISNPSNPKYSLDINPSKTFTIPNFFSNWYNEQHVHKIGKNFDFVLIATFIEMSKPLWNFSEAFSFSLTDVINQTDTSKQSFIDEIINKYVYPKDKNQGNVFNKLCYLCFTIDDNMYPKCICILKIIAYFYLSMFFASEHTEETQKQKEAEKLFLFLISLLILSANVNAEIPKKGTSEENKINKINKECLEVIVVVFGSLLHFYYETNNQILKQNFKDWFTFTFHLINGILNQKKTKRNSAHPINKVFREIFLNDKRKNILIDIHKFNIKLKTYNDMTLIIDNQDFWKPILETNKEIHNIIRNFYQKETIIQNCVFHYITVKNRIPVNIHLFEYHKLNLDKIREFDLKVESPYILLSQNIPSMHSLIQKQCEIQNDFEIQFLIEHSQLRRTFYYFHNISLYQKFKTNILSDLWDSSLYNISSNAIECDELYYKFFKKRYNDSEYSQRYYFECIYNSNNNFNNKGYVMINSDGIMFIGEKSKITQLTCFLIPFWRVIHINRIMLKDKNGTNNFCCKLEITCNNMKRHSFLLERSDFKEMLLVLKGNQILSENKNVFA